MAEIWIFSLIFHEINVQKELNRTFSYEKDKNKTSQEEVLQRRGRLVVSLNTFLCVMYGDATQI